MFEMMMSIRAMIVQFPQSALAFIQQNFSTPNVDALIRMIDRLNHELLAIARRHRFEVSSRVDQAFFQVPLMQTASHEFLLLARAMVTRDSQTLAIATVDKGQATTRGIGASKFLGPRFDLCKNTRKVSGPVRVILLSFNLR